MELTYSGSGWRKVGESVYLSPSIPFPAVRRVPLSSVELTLGQVVQYPTA